MPLIANPAISYYPFDGDPPMELCEMPANDGRTARYLFPIGTSDLLLRFNGCDELDDIVRAYRTASADSAWSETCIRSCVEQCTQRGLLTDARVQGPVYAKANDRATYVSFRVTLLSQRVVAAATRHCLWAFRAPLAAVLLSLALAAHVVFVSLATGRTGAFIGALDSGGVIAVLLVASVIGVIHELGHASALAHYAYSTASIGWGLYFSMKVFYTDLSDAWRLTRRQRAVVDLGGIYFQLLATACVIPIALYGESPILVCTVWFVIVQIVSSLNPLFRMDGYWWLSDVCGIADLRGYSERQMKAWVAAVMPKRTTRVSVPLVSPGTRRIIWWYSAIAIPLFTVTMALLCKHIVVGLAPMIADRAVAVVMAVFVTRTAGLATLGDILEVLWRVATLWGVAVFVVRSVRRLVAAANRIWAPV